MEKTKKQEIIRLRSEGLGYARIAKALGMKKDTVHTFCRRNGMAGNVYKDSFCKCCGKRIDSNDKGRKKSFCSTQCKNSWFNERRNHGESN